MQNIRWIKTLSRSGHQLQAKATTAATINETKKGKDAEDAEEQLTRKEPAPGASGAVRQVPTLKVVEAPGKTFAH